MPVDVKHIAAAVTDELADLLTEVAPEEADAAHLYVESPEAFEGRSNAEQQLGTPGAGFLALVGPTLLGFILAISRKFLEEVRDAAAKRAAEVLVEGLSKKFKKQARAASREETIAAVSQSLRAAGWPEERAHGAALRVWKSGEKLARRMT